MINNVEVKPEEYEEKYDAAWHALRQQQNNKKDKKEDEVLAFVGDGINDAPSLRKRRSTALTKEVILRQRQL